MNFKNIRRGLSFTPYIQRRSRPLLVSVFASCLVCIALITTLRPAARASDHGDDHIGDLYAFVSAGKLVLGMTIKSNIPQDPDAFRFSKDVIYRFLIDRDTEVVNQNVQAGERDYGGAIVKPETIKEDIVVEVHFPGTDNKPQMSVSGLNMSNGTTVSSVLLFTGVRDEPFIRRGLEGKNIAAIVVELPLHSIATGKPLLVWATTSDRKSQMLDLTGHPYYSQQPGNEKLNSTHPSEHTKLPGIKVPDVMIYDPARPAKYPNGRKLEDDVVNILNLQDRLPNELPSPDKNDLAFLPNFPYLAPPHDKDHEAFEQNAPKGHVGMRRIEMGKFDLGREFSGMGGRDARLRFWFMAPREGVIRFHKHAERPAIVYLLTGEVKEYKWGVAGPRIIKAGEATREAADTEHYWTNEGAATVLMAAVDMVEATDAAREGSGAPYPQPLPRSDIDLSKIEAVFSDFKPAEYKVLEQIQLRDSIPHIPDAHNYVMRGREITVKPNERIALQNHTGRPGITYVIQGVIIEYRNDREDLVPLPANIKDRYLMPLRAGDFTLNTSGVSRFLVNTSEQDVKLFEVDFLDTAKTRQ